jgi:hypothetical protein
MGQSESNPVKNIDKRTARREYHDDFSNAIQTYRTNVAHYYSNSKANRNDRIDSLRFKPGEIIVCVRKRPINKSELSNNEFDVITCLEDLQTILVHDARMGSDMKTQYLEHYPFVFNRIFDERTNNQSVYDATVGACIIDNSIRGKLSTCMMYGQVQMTLVSSNQLNN